METSTFIAEGITFDFNVTWLDARYADNLNPNDIDPTTGLSALASFNDRRLPGAPEWRANWILDVRRTIPGTDLLGTFNLNYNFRDAHITTTNLNPAAEVPSYGILGASIGMRTADEKYGVAIIASNLTDELETQYQFDTLFQPGSLSAFLTPPRTVSIVFDAKW